MESNIKVFMGTVMTELFVGSLNMRLDERFL
jgi:hypothetical protein